MTLIPTLRLPATVVGLIQVGTSGWSHPSWVGPFYPVGLREQPEAWLPFYATRFQTVEVSGTFDAFPSPEMVDAWARAGVDAHDRLGRAFEFSVKAPRALTHDAIPAGDAAAAREVAGRFDREVLDPLAGEGLLGAVLLQLPPRLAPSEATVALLQEVTQALAERRTALEFRHPDWARQGCVHPAAEPLFASPDVCLVQADGPGVPDVAPPVKARHVYVRFHGRRQEGWGAGVTDEAPRDGARYDHLYAPHELAPWVARLRGLAERHGQIRAYFNNPPGAKACANAVELLHALGQAPPVPRPRLTQQTRLKV